MGETIFDPKVKEAIDLLSTVYTEAQTVVELSEDRKEISLVFVDPEGGFYGKMSGDYKYAVYVAASLLFKSINSIDENGEVVGMKAYERLWEVIRRQTGEIMVERMKSNV